MDPSCLVSTVQAGSGRVMVWGIFSWHTLGPLVPIEHRLNATAYRSIIADHVHPFMTTVTHLLMATSSRLMHHVTKLKSYQTGFLNMTKSSLYSNGLHSHQILIQQSTFGMWCIMDVQLTKLQQLCDAIMLLRMDSQTQREMLNGDVLI